MIITWSPAVTLDGYIAKTDGDSSWVTDEDSELFNQLVAACGCAIVGRRTYEQYKGEVFPVDGATTFVWTRHPETGEPREGVEYVSGEPHEIVRLLESKGFSRAALAGGGQTNNAFVTAGLVDEITVTIYPLVFGTGIRLLTTACELRLELRESKRLGGGVLHNTYKVIR